MKRSSEPQQLKNNNKIVILQKGGHKASPTTRLTATSNWQLTQLSQALIDNSGCDITRHTPRGDPRMFLSARSSSSRLSYDGPSPAKTPSRSTTTTRQLRRSCWAVKNPQREGNRQRCPLAGRQQSRAVACQKPGRVVIATVAALTVVDRASPI